VRLAAETPSLDIGCHLVLVSGRSLIPPHSALPAGVTELLRALALGRVKPYEEFSAQIRCVVAAGIAPTHLDTHKHTHLAPPVLAAVARLSEEYRIPWVRRPFDFPLTTLRGTVPRLKQATSRGLHLLRRRFHAVLERYHCRTTDHFAGFQITGRFRTAQLVQLIRELPEGLTEFMCHPGYCTAELTSAHTRLKQCREQELGALIAPETRAALAECDVELVSYRSL